MTNRPADTPAPVLRQLQLMAEEAPVRLTVEDYIGIQAPDMGDHAIMLVRRTQADPWVALLVPPGSEWELRAKPSQEIAPRLVDTQGEALSS